MTNPSFALNQRYFMVYDRYLPAHYVHGHGYGRGYDHGHGRAHGYGDDAHHLHHANGAPPHDHGVPRVDVRPIHESATHQPSHANAHVNDHEHAGAREYVLPFHERGGVRGGIFQ